MKVGTERKEGPVGAEGAPDDTLATADVYIYVINTKIMHPLSLSI